MLQEHLDENGINPVDFDTWDFDIAHLPINKMQVVCTNVLTYYRCLGFDDPCGEAGNWGEICARFLSAINSRHANTNAFHNFAHAADVTFTLHRFLQENAAECFLAKPE